MVYLYIYKFPKLLSLEETTDRKMYRDTLELVLRISSKEKFLLILCFALKLPIKAIYHSISSSKHFYFCGLFLSTISHWLLERNYENTYFNKTNSNSDLPMFLDNLKSFNLFGHWSS